MLSGSAAIMLLFLINGIFRGAGDAAMAMKSLWIASIIDIILCGGTWHRQGIRLLSGMSFSSSFLLGV